MRWATAGLVLCVALAGCLGGPAVQNNPGAFEFTIDGQGSTDRYSYDWSNDASSARLSWDMTSATGTLTVEIRDASGTPVTSRTFEGGSSGSDQQTGSGRSGTWTIVIELQDVEGPVNVKVRSA